ncbi:hypothetical protein ABIC03_007638 [Bradyrhizobium sp. RT6a]|uniref:hypothetical protein n=1 Tax=Bradyrhizobium sp. RT6a TaxID=3156381 RepID=UPI0033927328
MAKSDRAKFWLAKTWINVVTVRVARRRRSAVLHLIAFSFTGFGVAHASLEQRLTSMNFLGSIEIACPAIALLRTAASGIPIGESLYGRFVGITSAFVADQLLEQWEQE